MGPGWTSISAGDVNIIQYGYDPEMRKKREWKVMKDKTYWFFANTPTAIFPFENRMRVFKYKFKFKKLNMFSSLLKYFPFFFIWSNENSTNFSVFSHYEKVTYRDP